MFEIIKEYYVFALLLLIFSFLVPREDYKSYIQFFIGIFVIVLLLRPVLKILTINQPSALEDIFSSFNTYIEEIELEKELEQGGNMYEFILFKGKEE